MLSIIVLSSDGYSDCWDPFFYLLHRNFPEALNFEIILSCNIKCYNYDGMNIKVLNHGLETPWSKRLKLSLDAAANDIVFVLVEDFFILSRMDISVFNNLLMMISTQKEIDHIRLLYKLGKVKTTESRYKFLDRIESRSKHRFLYLPGLWKKEVLRKYVTDFETPYMAEQMGDLRSMILDDGFFAISKSYLKKNGKLYDCPTSGAIIKGKWGKWLPERLEENDLDINLKLRGFKDKESNKKAKKEIYLYLLKNLGTTTRSFMSIIGLAVIQLKSVIFKK